MGLKVTKVDAARRQLVTAIKLFFEGGDSVSILSLAANAWEVIDALCARSAVKSMSDQVRSNLAPGKDLRRDYINSPFRNFFKHADRDPEAVLEDFSCSVVDSILFLAVEDYVRLRGQSPVEFQVLQLWYLACHPEKIARDRSEAVLRAADHFFPGIAKLPREQQIALGRDALESASRDPDVLGDSRTEQGH